MRKKNVGKGKEFETVHATKGKEKQKVCNCENKGFHKGFRLKRL